MKTSLRFVLGAGLVLSSLLASCRSGAGNPDSHWNIDSVDNRIVKQFTGYRGSIDGTYLEYQRQKKNDLNLTLKRHFLGVNPTNPFQTADSNLTSPNAPYGPLPDPVYWFGAESVFIGAATLAWTGTFLLLPLDSLFALGSEGGMGQFASTFAGNWTGKTPTPPKTSTFKVKNR